MWGCRPRVAKTMPISASRRSNAGGSAGHDTASRRFQNGSRSRGSSSRSKSPRSRGLAWYRVDQGFVDRSRRTAGVERAHHSTRRNRRRRVNVDVGEHTSRDPVAKGGPMSTSRPPWWACPRSSSWPVAVAARPRRLLHQMPRPRARPAPSTARAPRAEHGCQRFDRCRRRRMHRRERHGDRQRHRPELRVLAVGDHRQGRRRDRLHEQGQRRSHSDR